MNRLFILFTALILCSPTIKAVEPEEVLRDPKLEERARALSKGLRCLVCQNQSIDDSDANLARDLRILVREKLKSGDSDEEIIKYVVSRYGDFVLLKPPLNKSTFILWMGPVVIFIFGLIMVLFYMMRMRHAKKAIPLTEEEKNRLTSIRELR